MQLVQTTSPGRVQRYGLDALQAMRFGQTSRLGRNQRFGLDAREIYLPTIEGDCALWLDVFDPAAISVSGGVIDYFVNKVSSFHITAAGSARAAYEATGLNGKPTAHPDGITNQYIWTEAPLIAALEAPTVALPCTLIMVVQPDVLDVNAAIFAAGNSGYSGNNTRRWGQSTNASGRYMHGGQTDSGAAPVHIYDRHPVTTDAVVYVAHGTTNHTIQINNEGAETDSVDPVVTLINQIALFCRPDSSPDLRWAGRMSELVFYSADKPLDAIGRCVDYLLAKWAIVT